MDTAFKKLSKALEEGPVIASVYYTFDPKSPIPHLVVINGIDGDRVYYNDPSEDTGGGNISLEKFKKAWKKRYIEIRSARQVI
jgi:predicted double-glycine peptidase